MACCAALVRSSPLLGALPVVTLLLLAVACGDGTTSEAESPPAPDAGSDARELPGSEAGASGTVCAPAPMKLETPGTADCPIAKPDAPDAFDAALARAGTDRCALSYSASDPYNKNPDPFPYRLPFFDPVHDHAVRAPSFARKVTSALDEAAASKLPVASALQVAAFAFGGDATPCADPFELDVDQPLARAVAKVIRDAGGQADDATLEADAEDVPKELQVALAEVILAAGEAQAAWTALASRFTKAQLAELGKVHGILMPTLTGAANVKDASIAKALSDFDTKALVAGAVKLALRVERADLGRFRGLRGFSFEQKTPLGRIVVKDAADHVHAKGTHVLLAVDTGGNDTYLFPAGAVDAWHEGEEGHHVGLAIDLDGNDTYAYDVVANVRDGKRLPSDEFGRSTAQAPDKGNGPISLSETLRQGAARLGYGMLFDLGAGSDTYRSLLLSQGYGEGGVGVLYDEAGNDRYESEAGAQGAAHLGVGLLIDRAGDDTYRTYSQAQGFAATKSVGILYDADGKDTYVADNGDPADGGDPLYWTIQIPGKGNNSFAQGAAWGLRGSGGWPNMSGGLGVLRDLRGNDTYEASVQAQASAYWYGTGILADGAGDDRYDARYYVQGAGAHFGLSVFLEEGGNDTYQGRWEPKATSIGVGHDRSVAWHLDLGGNDVYRAPGLSLGSGYANGMSFLVNVGGDDVYRAPNDLTLGAASLSQEWWDAFGATGAKVPTVGIFLDVGGKDLYEATGTTGYVDGASWSVKKSPPAWSAVEQSSGADVASGEVKLP